MAFQIRISPEALRLAAEQERKIRETVVDCVSTMDEIRAILGESWEGMAGDQAINALESIRTVSKRVAEGVGEGAAKLDDFVTAFEALDNESPIGVLRKIPTGFIPAPIHPVIIWSQPGNVRIIPDRIRDVASICQKTADRVFESRDRFTQIMEKLQTEWEGRACNKYIDESSETISALYEVGDALSELANRLRSAAARYEELDNSL